MLVTDDPHRLTAIFPPWWPREEILVAASHAGAVAGFGPLPFIVAVGSHEAGLPRRLKTAGALIVVDGSQFAFCAF